MKRHRIYYHWACFVAVVISAWSISTSHAQQEKLDLRKMTVYYLKHAEAEAVANTIDAFFEGTETAPKLKIIPDARTNALFISVPDEAVKEIEEFLKILDGEKPASEFAPSGKKEVKIFTLQNADAAEAMQALKDLVGNEVQLTTDPHTNSVISSGRKDALAIVEAILLRLDEADNPRSNVLKVYPIKHVSMDKATETLVQFVQPRNFSMDETGSRLIVRGDEETHALVTKLLETIDVPDPKPAPKRLQVRIIWLVDEKLAGKDASPPSKDLEKVVRVLDEKLGIANLKMAAQVLVNVDTAAEGRPFTARGTTKFAEIGDADLNIEGVVKEGRTSTMEISIQAEQQTSPNPAGAFRGRSGGDKQLASLNTSVAAPIGHSIVLGMTPIQSANSVFVLQVLADDAPPAAENGAARR